MSAAVLIISPLGLFFIYMCVYVSVCVMALDMGLLADKYDHLLVVGSASLKQTCGARKTTTLHF